MHHDFRTGNCMVDADGLVGVLDWEFAAWGDPLTDRGWFCARYWRSGRENMDVVGLGTRSALHPGYKVDSGRAVEDATVHFSRVTAHVRLVVITLQQGYRHVFGSKLSLELALMVRRPLALKYHLLQITDPGLW